MKLTPAQKSFVEENHNLIYWLLQRMNCNVDEYYGAAAIGLCKAAATWNKSKSKFSTFANAVMRHEIYMQMRSESRSPKNTVSLDTPINVNTWKTDEKPISLEVAAPDMLEKAEERIDAQVAVSKAEKKMTPKEKMAFELAGQGKYHREIAEIMGISHPYASKLVRLAYNKCRQAYSGENR